MSHTEAVVVFFLLFVALPTLVYIASLRFNRKVTRIRAEQQQQEASLSLVLDPQYQQHIAAERADKLAWENLNFKKEQWREEYALKKHMSLHRVPAGVYAINEEITSVTALLARAPEKLADQAEALLQAPHAPPFQSVLPMLQSGRLVLGYSAMGPVWGEITDLLSMAFAGMPGTGKSQALLYYLAVLCVIHAKTAVLDPHGSLNALGDMLPYCSDLGDMQKFIPRVQGEYELRLKLWKRNRTVLDPFLLIVDELPIVARYEQKHRITDGAMELAETIVLEGRKLNMFTILAAQSFPATVLPTLTRDNLSSRLVFNSKDMHAKMAGLEKEERENLLPLLKKAQPGTAILDVNRSGNEPQIVSLPYTTIDDLREVLEGCEEGATDEGVSASTYSTPIVTPANTPAWEADAMRVRDLRAKGLNQDQIIENVWGVRKGTNAKYHSARNTYREIIATLKAIESEE
jgi:hypothetical protein